MSKGSKTFQSHREFAQPRYSVGVLILGILTSLLSSQARCSSPLKYLFQTPGSLNIPFPASSKGALAEGLLKVPSKDSYAFFLRLECKEGNAADYSRVQILAGAPHTDQDGHWVKHQLSIPLRLIVVRVQPLPQQTIIDRAFSNEPVSGWNPTSFFNLITNIQLEKGNYQIAIESLERSPDLDLTPIFLDVHVPYRS